MPGFIAVHVGAGTHSESLVPSYHKTCKEACRAAMMLLKEGCGSVEAITAAVSVLEDAPIANAGIGSNLTLKRTVECDAAVMEGSGLNFGSVGALSNIRNPVQVARKVLEAQTRGLSCGRVPPCTLVGPGALDWALKNGFMFFKQEDMITESADKQHAKYHRLVTKEDGAGDKQVTEYNSTPNNNSLLDTVGAVCVDDSGTVSAAVSSGGLLLKIPGRIGQAATFGAGCWAQNSTSTAKPSIACSVTGVGEYLIKTLFAKECYQTLYDRQDSISALPDVFRDSFLDSPYLRNAPNKQAGVVVLKHYRAEGLCELAWAHNTKTMVLGYGSTSKGKVVSILSQQPPDTEVSKYGIVGGEKCLRLLS